jgi:hypothetical protein
MGNFIMAVKSKNHAHVKGTTPDYGLRRQKIEHLQYHGADTTRSHADTRVYCQCMMPHGMMTMKTGSSPSHDRDQEQQQQRYGQGQG